MGLPGNESPALGRQRVMQLLQFRRRVTVTGKAAIQTAAEFCLPFGIVLPAAPAQILRQIESLLGGHFVHRVL